MMWQPIETAPKDGTRFMVIKWWRDYSSGDPTAGYWSDPQQYAWETDAKREQCFHSIPRQTCIRDTTIVNGRREYDDVRWTMLPPLPASPFLPAKGGLP